MNREIKFRAWNKVAKTMYGDAVNNCKDTFDMILKHPQIYEVMQYTGVKDKNSVEIFEGDILNDNGYLYLVEYDNGFKQHAIYDNWLKKNVFNRDEITWLSQVYCNRYEVIGNIFENSDLLEQN